MIGHSHLRWASQCHFGWTYQLYWSQVHWYYISIIPLDYVSAAINMLVGLWFLYHCLYPGTIFSVLGSLSVSVLVFWSLLVYRWVVSCTQTASRCCCDVTAGCTWCQTFSELSKYYYWGTAAHCRPYKYDICILVLLLSYWKKIFVRTEIPVF